MASSGLYELATETAERLRTSLPTELRNPAVGIICGSGLGGLADAVHLAPKHEIDYSRIPHFPRPTVHGHVGKLVFGLIGPEKTPAVFMMGRAHFYEGNTMEQITFPVRVLKVLGIRTMIVTNAAGGLNSAYNVGDIVVMSDHLNLAGLVGVHPLRGPNAESFGPRFPALSDAYDLELRRIAHQVWRRITKDQASRRLHEGVYAFVGGPSYETRAECRMLHQLGADLVGMSTVPEIIVARHCGIRILALSLVTNNGVLEAGPRGDDIGIESVTAEQLNDVIEQGRANHEEVIQAGHQAAKDMQVLVQQIIETIFQQRKK